MHNDDPKRWGREHRPMWDAAPETRSPAPAWCHADREWRTSSKPAASRWRRVVARH